MLYLALATFFSGLTFFLVKVVTTKLHPILGSPVSACASIGVQLLVFLYFKWKGTTMPLSTDGLQWGILMGALGALYVIFLYFAFARLDVTKATPVLYLGSLVIATVLGVVFLKEEVNAYHMAGFVLAGASIFLLLWK